MSNLGHIHQQLAHETGRFLLMTLRAAIDGAAAALAEKRHANDVERDRLRDGFRSAAMAYDIFNHEKSRRKLGMEPAFAPELVDNLGKHAAQLARQTGLLEAYGDPYVLEFYDRLQLRMQKALLRPMPDPLKLDDTEKRAEPGIHFMAEPTPERGYSALAKLDGRHAEMKAKAFDHALLQIAKPGTPLTPAPVAAPVAESPTRPVAEAPAAPVAAPVTEPAQDAVWSDPELLPEANYFWNKVVAWGARGDNTPPPRPSERLWNAIMSNPAGNAESIKMLKWIHQKDPPDEDE